MLHFTQKQLNVLLRDVRNDSQFNSKNEVKYANMY